MLVELNTENFKVNNNEFTQVFHQVYNNLKIIPELGIQERTVSLLSELSTMYEEQINAVFLGISHGGYIPIKCAKNFKKVYIFEYDIENITYNIDSHKVKNIVINNEIEEKVPYILYTNDTRMSL